MEIKFHQRDCDMFATASGDRNLLHLDRAYARNTPFRDPVVYGLLAVVKMLQMALEPSDSITAVKADFQVNPILNHYYSLTALSKSSEKLITLSDGTLELVRVEVVSKRCRNSVARTSRLLVV